MNKYIMIFCVSILLAFYACMDDDTKKHGLLNVELSFQEEFINTNSADIDVLLTNRNTGRKFLQKTNNSGLATFDVEEGIYNVSSVYNMNSDTVFNGNLSDIIVTSKTYGQEVNMKMVFGKLSPLVFKEIYYTGVKTPKKKTYYSDQFDEVYNNSNEVQYLDGLCLAVLEGSSMSPSKWVDDEGDLLPVLPVNWMAWRIPGNGTEYPLYPGESVVIALDAINHHSDPSGNSNSTVDFSNADWEIYFDLSGRDTDNPNVPNMEMIWTNNTTMPDWMHLTMGSAVVLFRIPGSWKEFVDNPDNLMTKPKTTSSKKYLMIPKEYVIDAVECVHSETKNHKRLHKELDAGYIYCSGMWEKESIRRKVKDIIGGRVIYQDTNNSKEDFIVSKDQTPWINPTSVD